MKTTIRKSDPKSANELTLIAHISKRYWGYPESSIREWENELTITKEFIQANQVFEIVKSKKTVGFYALDDKDEGMSIEHFWILPEYIGNGLGTKLFQHAVKIAGSMSAKWFEIVSDPNAEGFFVKMGAKRIGDLVTQLEGRPRRLPLFKYKFPMKE